MVRSWSEVRQAGGVGQESVRQESVGQESVRQESVRQELVRNLSDKSPSDRSPPGRSPAGRSPLGRSPSGRSPSGRSPSGRSPSGRSPSGRSPSGRNPSENDQEIIPSYCLSIILSKNLPMHCETCTWDSDAGTWRIKGGHWPGPPQYLANQSTLFHPGSADYPYLLLLAPPMFFTFWQHWVDKIFELNLYRN